MITGKKKTAIALAFTILTLTAFCSCKGRDGKDVIDRNSEIDGANGVGNDVGINGIRNGAADGENSNMNNSGDSKKNIPDNDITKDSTDTANIS